MHITKTLSRLALSTLLGLALAGTLSTAPAFADHNPNDEDEMFDPAPLSYPQAAPGSLDLYRWKDYTKTKMETGSVGDKRWEMQRKEDKERHERMVYFHKMYGDEKPGRVMYHHADGRVDWYDEDEMWDPAPLAYPQAAPGSLDLYHWKDYTQTRMRTGSVYDQRWNQEHMKERARRENMEHDKVLYSSKDWDNEDQMWDPAPLSYPQAAPGSLDLYHWKDYTQTRMRTGSVEDQRWNQEHKKEKERRERMKNNGTGK